MPAPYSDDLSWRVVWLSYLEGRSAKKVSRRLYVSLSTVRRIRRCFKVHGDVRSPAARRAKGGQPPAISPVIAQEIIDLVVDSPHCTACETYQLVCQHHGLDLHYSTFCRALHELGLSCKRLRGYAARRDAAAALAFKASLMQFDPEQLFFLDETAKDPRDINRRNGWALRGVTPEAPLGFKGRGKRISSLVGVDVEGFVDWYSIGGTFKRANFLRALEETVIPHMTPFPGPRSVVIMDNASIHKSAEVRAMIQAANGILLFTPPYCFDCTPLDNGAFGWVSRKLKQLSDVFKHVSLARALDHVFRRAAPKHARSWFRNCGYL